MRLIFFFLLCCVSLWAADDPIAVYLMMQDNPESSMTVCWITPSKEKPEALKYREAASNDWFQLDIEPRPFPEKLPYSLFVAEIENLKPSSCYQFVLEEAKSSYAFCTLPATLEASTRPLKFVVGGDIYHDSIDIVERMNRIAARQNPDFALLGGDIAYSGAKFFFLKEESNRWIDFLKIWSKTMVKSDGTLIPFVTAIGNHDVTGRYDQNSKSALFYQFLFPKPVETNYRVVDFGDYLSLWILDTGHTHPVPGDQTVWLEETLKARQHRKLKMALYHVPAYPCARSYDNSRSKVVRLFWTPLFEKYGLKVAFENHDHAYKRTHLIKNGKVSENGVVYIGDGAWGVESPRLPKSPDALWYLANSSQKTHIVLVIISPAEVSIKAIDASGDPFDSFTF